MVYATTPTSRRQWLGLAGAAAVGLTRVGTALAETSATVGDRWRLDGPVTFLVPSGPGAALDLSARNLSSILETQQAAPSIVITNRTGGAGAPVLQQLRQEAGNPRLIATLTASFLTGHASGVLAQNYTDFTTLAVLLEEYVSVAVRADSPLRNVQDLTARLKQDAGGLSIGVASALGNHVHIGIARPLAHAGVDTSKLTVVPFKSSAESITALLGGHLDVVSCTTPNVVGQLKAGKIRVLAIDAPQRLAGGLSEVLTWREQGIDVTGVSSQGVLAPKGISEAARQGWVKALRAATDTPQWQNFLTTNQLRPRFIAGDEAAAYLDRQYVELAGTLKHLGLAGKSA